MKLLRYGSPGAEKPGILDANGVIRDLSGKIGDLTADTYADLSALKAIDLGSLPAVSGSPRLGPPIAGVRQFIAIGLNYVDHAKESNLPIPEEPIFFTKGVSCIVGPNDDIEKPHGATKMDWEVELGIVIGKQASYVDEADAMAHVAGFVLVHDVSERAFQIERGGTWDKGKGCPTFGPIGPWVVTTDEVGDFDNLDMWLDVNGERMQTGNTKTMIFNTPKIVSYVSQFMKLLPGDVITTGTPPGVGLGMKPPKYLNVGDKVTLGIAKLGEQATTVIAPSKGAK